MIRMCKKNKVLNAIVIFYTVYMMNNFALNKVSSNVFFHYKSMFQNIKIRLNRIGMISFKDMDVSTQTNDSSAFPTMAFFAKLKNGAMTTSRAIFHMGGASRKKSFAGGARSFVVNLLPGFFSPVPNALSRISPKRVILNIGNVVVRSVHVRSTIPLFSVGLA